MKNVFGRNFNNKQDYVYVDGVVFTSNEIDCSLQQQVMDNDKLIKNLNKKSELPNALKIIRLIAFYIMFIFLLFSFINMIINGNILSKVYIYLGSFSIVIWIYLFYFQRRKINNVIKSNEFINANRISKELDEKCINQLQIPLDAKIIDVLMVSYLNDKGTIKITSKYYINLPLYVYIKKENLCFADNQKEISISLTEIKRIKEVKRQISITYWNKDISYNDGEYKKYKIVKDYNTYILKQFYSIDINHDGEDYELYIPSYDIKTILDLTNLKVVE